MTVSAVLFLIIGVATVVSAELKNVAEGKTANQSSTYGTGNDYAAEKALDGSTNYKLDGNSCFHTKKEAVNWWYVDLGQVYDKIMKIKLYNRLDCCVDRTREIAVLAGVTLDTLSQVKYLKDEIGCGKTINIEGGVRGRYVKLVHTAGTAFHLCEVRVFAEM